MHILIVKACHGLLLFIILSGIFTGSVVATELKVRGNRVILRAAPSDNSEIVAQVSDGDMLVAEKDLEGEWIGIIPPEKVNFWVYAELVQDGVVIASKVQIRVGPGINYRSVGEVAKDTKVSIRGEYREWLKISPPSGCRLWVHRTYVDAIDKAGLAERSGIPAGVGNKIEGKSGAVEKVPVLPKKNINPPVLRHVPDQRSPAISKNGPPASQVQPVSPRRQVNLSPEAAIRDKLASSREQGRAIQYGGALRYAGLFVWRQPSRYRLVFRDNNGIAITLCHVLGDEKELAELLDKEVTIHGREYWVQGVRQPVVIPDRILPKN